MKVTIEIEVDKCSKCPFYIYGGTSWGEDIYLCDKTGSELLSCNSIPNWCPFIESTMEKLRNKIK